MLKRGDKVKALRSISRLDGLSHLDKDETATIQLVWVGERSQIVTIIPDDKSRQPIADVVCLFDGDPVFEVIANAE